MRMATLLLVLAATVSAGGCILTPANGDSFRESDLVPFAGYAQDDLIALQAEVITSFRQDPNCTVDPCAIEICTAKGGVSLQAFDLPENFCVRLANLCEHVGGPIDPSAAIR